MAGLAPPRWPLSLALYACAGGIAAPALDIYLRRRAARGKEDPARLAERRGLAAAPRPEGRLVWIHAASVGETLSILPLVERLTQHAVKVLLTTGTLTSAAMAARRLPEGAIHHFVPLDLPQAARRFFDHWRPDLVLFVESEFWPNLMREAYLRRIPLGVVNGRMSERSFARWRSFAGSARALLAPLDFCLAQSADDAARLRGLGAPALAGGNIKFDAKALPVDRHGREALLAAIGPRPILLAASTHPGEEAQVLAAAAQVRNREPELLTILVPRHPERGDEIAALAASGGMMAPQRSKGELPDALTTLYIADTLDELGLFYSIAGVAFVGGSLVALGGHNPIEPARFGTPVLTGPHIGNFADIYAAFIARSAAVMVEDAASLAASAAHLIRDAAARAALAQNARSVAEENAGAIDLALEAVLSRLGERGMKTPAFWRRDQGGLPARLLAPLGGIYGRLTLARMAGTGWRAPVPIIAIGNATAGGAGKTPTAMALARALQARGHQPFIVTRGYGGRLAGPVLVAGQGAAEVGDEALLLARAAPTLVARERAAGARLAIELGARCLILDDALQNPALVKDFTLCVVDGAGGLGNGRVVPAGPLRAPLRGQLPFISAFMVVGTPHQGLLAALGGARPLYTARLLCCGGADLAGRPVIAFCGLGLPEKFEATLREAGAVVSVLHRFGDHHDYSEAEAGALLREAAGKGAHLVTTAKDHVRLAGGPARERLAAAAAVIEVEMQLAPELVEAMAALIAARR